MSKETNYPVKRWIRNARGLFASIFQRRKHSHSIQTLQMALDGKDALIKKLQEKNRVISTQYQQLEMKLTTTVDSTKDEERIAFYRALEPIILQTAVIRDDLKKGTKIPIKEVIIILESIPKRLESLGIKQFVGVGEIAEFNPQYHTPVMSEAEEINEGEIVISIVPGYKYMNEILLRAEVRKNVE